MNKIIYAKSLSNSIIKKLDKYNKVHSIFQSGINIETKGGLIFIGEDKNGRLPFGIHLDEKDIRELLKLDNKTIFTFNKDLKLLQTSEYIIDLNKSIIYSSKLPRDKGKICYEKLKYLLTSIIEMDLTTGLDIKLEDILGNKLEIISKLKDSMESKDEQVIKNALRPIIGRGRGLTPSGDDLLIGLLWINEIVPVLSKAFLNVLQSLILEGDLTTDVSLNYYKSAFIGDYSSNLIYLACELISFDRGKIKSRLKDIVQYGHTSGIDLLTGIALGVDTII